MNSTAKIFLGVLSAGVIAVVLYFSFSTSKESTKGDLETDVIAVVGSSKLRVKQFIDEAKRRGGAHPEKIDKQMLLNEMIDYEAIVNQAVQEGLDQDPEIVRMYRNILVGKYKQRHLTPQIESTAISDDDVRKIYDENLEHYTQRPKIRIAMLTMAFDSTMSEEKKNAIRERMAEAREKALLLKDELGFGALAVDYSEDQTTRYKGGDIGWISEGIRYRWDQPVLDAGFAIQTIGDISSIIETENGVYLVKLMDKRSSEITPFEKVKERIRHKALLDNRKEIEKQFMEKLRRSVEIKTYPNVLDSIQLEPSGDKEPAPPKLP